MKHVNFMVAWDDNGGDEENEEGGDDNKEDEEVKDEGTKGKKMMTKSFEVDVLPFAADLKQHLSFSV